MDSFLFLQAAAALLLVLGLIGLLGWALRRYGGGVRAKFPAGGARRLALVESLPLDARQRLILVSRDDTEHLLLVGPERAIVVEGGIAPPSAGKGRAQ